MGCLKVFSSPLFYEQYSQTYRIWRLLYAVPDAFDSDSEVIQAL